jgi:hypothetical protein
MTAASAASAAKAPQQTIGYRDRPWIPRIWNGMTVRGLFLLLIRNRFAVAPRRLGRALVCALACPMNSLLGILQKLLLGRRIARTHIEHGPIFIIGHWRAGTTLLHEMMALDRRHTFANTYDCLAPNHFLISSRRIKGWLASLLPAQRPMDNMAFGWDRPQEDEFALCNMGVRSPYLTLAFPNRPPQDQEYFELREVPQKQRERWKRAVVWFLKCLTLRIPKRIVLKSPSHTFRISVLLELFPKAHFIHVVRDPYVIFPSTINLWKRLSRDEGFQTPRHEGLEEYVFRTLGRMYEVFERDRRLLAHWQLCEVRYEELIKDPIGQMRRIYEQLELGEVGEALPALNEYVAARKDYKTNRYEISPEVRARIGRRWRRYIERYGYTLESAGG